MPIPVLTVAQMREWEKATWAAKRTPAQVISRVGHLVAARVKHLTRPGDLVLILAGKGHNGDDARQVVQNLPDHEVNLLNVFEPARALREFNSRLSLPPALIVDGLFGIGLNRPLDAQWTRLIERVNRANLPVLAIDVPSGLNADSGEIEGASLRAAVTLTLGAPKAGLLEPSAWPCVGRLEVEPDIGLVPCPVESDKLWTLGSDFDGWPASRPVHGHKGTFGHLVIFAGSAGYHGAAVLAAKAALRAQPGLVSLVVPEPIYVPVASQLSAVMVHPWKSGFKPPDTCTAVAFGPGLAAPDVPDTFKASIVRLWQEFPKPVVADASGLDWFPQGATRAKATRVLTPHPGEAARLLKSTSGDIQSDRLGTIRRLSQTFGHAWVVLKGHQTLIGRSKGPLHFNSSGNPHLAQGGSGDVLTGFLGGLLAQPALADQVETTLRFGVWEHGAAADRLTAEHSNWIVEDLLPLLGSR